MVLSADSFLSVPDLNSARYLHSHHHPYRSDTLHSQKIIKITDGNFMVFNHLQIQEILTSQLSIIHKKIKLMNGSKDVP
jgi:hypothetical protein